MTGAKIAPSGRAMPPPNTAQSISITAATCATPLSPSWINTGSGLKDSWKALLPRPRKKTSKILSQDYYFQKIILHLQSQNEGASALFGGFVRWCNWQHA